MLLLGEKLLNMPVMGIHTGTRLAVTKEPIVDPANLKIVAYEVDGPRIDVHPTYLRIADIRELSDIGMIIDSSDEFVGYDDVVRLQKLIDLKFRLPGIHVIDENHRKIGKVKDFIVDTGSFVVQQLIVDKNFLKSLAEPEVIIHRSQIIEISDTLITVKSGLNRRAITATPPTELKFMNPFRSNPAPQTENQSKV